jgi:hypothetical protein
MALLFIHAINAEYQSCDAGAEYGRPEDALAAGVRSAAILVADEIGKGLAAASVEVRVEQADGTPMLRSVVSLSVTPLLPSLSARAVV